MHSPIRTWVTSMAAMAAALLTTASPALAGAPPAPVPATTEWSLTAERERCVLSRDFGAGKTFVRLRLTSYGAGEWFEVDAFGNMHGVSVASFRFLPDGKPTPRIAAAWGSTPYNRRSLGGWMIGGSDLLGRVADMNEVLPPVTAAQAQAQHALAIDIRTKRFVLDTGPMAAPLEQLRACRADMVRGWGLDPEGQSRLKSRPQPVNDRTRWFTTADFPSFGASGIQSGQVFFRLMVDEQGRATSCHVQNEAAEERLGQLTCKLALRRAKLRPAIGADGAAVASTYAGVVTWGGVVLRVSGGEAAPVGGESATVVTAPVWDRPPLEPIKRP